MSGYTVSIHCLPNTHKNWIIHMKMRILRGIDCYERDLHDRFKECPEMCSNIFVKESPKLPKYTFCLISIFISVLRH